MSEKELEKKAETLVEELEPTRDREGKLRGRYITLDTDNRRLYEWIKEHGYEGGISDFVNEVIQNFFKDRNLKLAVILTEEDP